MHGSRHGVELFTGVAGLINIGARPPEPFSPWHIEHFWAKIAAPSFAVPFPGGRFFPSGLMVISSARISSGVGVFPTP
jgi:hypothetical protein